MKRILMVLVLAGAAAIPATSSADDVGKETAARGAQDLSIEFILRSLGNEPKEIKNFKFENFTVNCATGGPVEAKGKISEMKINGRGKFDGNAKKGKAKVHVEGEVKQNGKKVVGFLKSSGDFGNGENCKTKVDWIAE